LNVVVGREGTTILGTTSQEIDEDLGALEVGDKDLDRKGGSTDVSLRDGRTFRDLGTTRETGTTTSQEIDEESQAIFGRAGETSQERVGIKFRASKIAASNGESVGAIGDST